MGNRVIALLPSAMTLANEPYARGHPASRSHALTWCRASKLVKIRAPSLLLVMKVRDTGPVVKKKTGSPVLAKLLGPACNDIPAPIA